MPTDVLVVEKALSLLWLRGSTLLLRLLGCMLRLASWSAGGCVCLVGIVAELPDSWICNVLCVCINQICA